MPAGRKYKSNDPSLNSDLTDIERRLSLVETKEKVFSSVTITTTGTVLRHRLGAIPKLSVVPKSAAHWWEYRNRDKEAVYLMADSDLVAEVTLTR